MWERKLVPDPLKKKKKSKLSISLNQQSKVSNSLLLLYAQAEDYPNISQLRC